MEIKVKINQKELDSMNLDIEKLQELILERLDSTKRNNMKIFHQIELSVETEIVPIKKFKN